MSTVSDSFDRADNASSLGTADSGEAWASVNGTWGVTGNQAYLAGSGGLPVAAIDTDHENITATVTIAATGGFFGVFARGAAGMTSGYDDKFAVLSNTHTLLIYKFESGAITTLASVVHPVVAGDTLGIRCSGTTISALVNGVIVASATSSAHLTNTVAGLYLSTGLPTWGDARFDNFSAVEYIPPPTWTTSLIGMFDTPSIETFGLEISGTHLVPGLMPVIGALAGVFDVPAIQSYESHTFGTYDLPAIVNVSNELSGVYSILQSYEHRLTGLHSFASPRSAALRGLHAFAAECSATLAGLYAYPITYTTPLMGIHRIANDALDRYELFIGTDAAPDLNGSPTLTAVALPLTTGELEAGHTYHLITKKRNRWGLVSGNTVATMIVVDDDGLQSDLPPGVAQQITLTQSGPAAVLTAEYLYALEGDRAADEWLVFVRTDGTDPNTSTDAPTVYPVVDADGVGRLIHGIPYLAHGDVVKAILRLRRRGPTASLDVLGPESPVVSLTISLTPAQPPRSSGFYGRSLGQA